MNIAQTVFHDASRSAVVESVQLLVSHRVIIPSRPSATLSDYLQVTASAISEGKIIFIPCFFTFQMEKAALVLWLRGKPFSCTSTSGTTFLRSTLSCPADDRYGLSPFELNEPMI